MNEANTTGFSTPTQISPDGPAIPITLTDSAIAKVRDFLAKSPDAATKIFRVSVEGGGCSGYQYGFALDTKRDDDMVLEFGDIKVLLDPQSRLLLSGSVVDYVDDFKGSGFAVKNPQAKGTCGCGVSFTV